jgi:RNA polymerase sigma factor (sigma-70 family)
MSRTATVDERSQSPPSSFPSDAPLVRRCLEGSEDAWSQLLDKYRSLIFSVPVKYGFSREEAADVFQDVCYELFSQLRNLREPQALPKWLVQVTTHKCFYRQRRVGRVLSMDVLQLERVAERSSREPLEIITGEEQQQEVRAAIAALPVRGQRLVRMLFFEDPPRPYEEIARALGVATGSVGFLRQRCLHFLRREMQRIQRL